MKKKIVPIITVLVLIVCGIFVVVSNKKNETNLNNISDTKINETNKENKDDKTNSNSEITTEENTNNEIVEKDNEYVNVEKKDLPDWTKFELKINDKNITLPILYSDFEETNYKLQDIRESDKFNSLQGIPNIKISDSNNHTIYINIKNRNDEECSFYDCYITGIKVLKEDGETNITFPNDISFESTYDEVLNKLGEPSRSYQPNKEITSIWTINDLYTYSITFDENKNVIKIGMNTLE